MKKSLFILLVTVMLAILSIKRNIMSSASEVLEVLDNANYGCNEFVYLGHPYTYLIDSRLNVFRDGDKWAVAIEKLGYNPRGGRIDLEIYYYGNCLQNLDVVNGSTVNTNSVSPIELDQFWETVDGECLMKDAAYWLVRGEQVALSHNKEDYNRAGIVLKEFNLGEIGVEEAARLLIIQYASLFRATDEELYKSLPRNLKKILVLDEWYHKDFYLLEHEKLSDNQVRETYELNKKNSPVFANMPYDEFVASVRRQEEINGLADREMWNNNRPSTYETWQQLAKVVETGDIAHYQPTVGPNTHWGNYPESGSL